MKLGYELTIEQKQQLSMTPELIQAIKILQLNSLDLLDYIKNEILENPILEEDTSEQSRSTEEIDIREKVAEDEYDDIRDRMWENHSDKDDYSLERFTIEPQLLEDYLVEQLYLTNLKGYEKKIGLFIIDALDENGYITLTKDEIIKETNSDLDTVNKVLEQIHMMEPVGVGAFSLEECLEIQLSAKGILTDEIKYVIEKMLDDVAENRITNISKLLGTKPEHVQELVDIIKSLEPKPGRQFAGSESTRYIVPDIIVERVENDYILYSNDSNIPTLKVSSYYNQLSEQAKKDSELNDYLNGKFNSAMWLIKSIEQRKQTILNVAKAVVKSQKIFFDKGEKYLIQLTLKEIASKLNIHESTVSRAINGKYMQTPMGVFELKYFFTSGVNADGVEGGISSVSVKSIIKEIIEGENPKKPYSDQTIVELLENKGIEISRRTVAKYRESLGIPSSSKRRRF